MDLIEFYENITPAQADLVSAVLSFLSVAVAAILGPIILYSITKKSFDDFNSAVGETAKSAKKVSKSTSEMKSQIGDFSATIVGLSEVLASASETIATLEERTSGLNEILSAIQKNTALTQGQDSEDRQIIEQAAVSAPSTQTTGHEKLKDYWSALRDKIEDIASNPSIDGRTRAGYARIDRRDYRELIAKLSDGGLLGEYSDKWIEAVNLWYTYRPNNQAIPEQSLDRLKTLSQDLTAIDYGNRETSNSLAETIRIAACAGQLPLPLTANIIVSRYGNIYSEATLKSVLANYTEGGYFANWGGRAYFRRVGTGKYEPICD
jgi:hypothetical protein